MKFVKSLNNALDKLLAEHDNVYLYGEDLVDPYGGAFKVSKGLFTKYPDKVFSTPISEAMIVGMAGGMAIGGLRPIVEVMFGDFLALAADQILNHLTKYAWMYNEKVKVPVTIRTAMGGRRGYGPTHSQSLEPLMATIPLLRIVSPSQYHDPGDLLETCVLKDDYVKVFSEHKMLYPKELRTNDSCPDGINVEHSKSMYPTIYLSNCQFECPDLVIVSHGGNSIIIEELMIDLLIEHEINVETILPSLIKPFPYDDIIGRIKRVSAILFIEESPVSNGWSSEIVAHLTEIGLLNNKRIIRIGAKEMPIPSARYLEDKVLPSKDRILSEITHLLGI
jgi:pyruvate/2-oxoglutarate/acetoin dehydrogenase E1 component